MTILQAIAFGLLQGLTEFLPVSSSGHLTLFQMIYHLDDLPLTFDILLHVGTLIAVFWVYWRRILNMILHPLKSELKWLVLATVPAVVVTLTVKDAVDAVLTGKYLGIGFLLTSFVLLLSEGMSRFRKERHKSVTWYDALAMGVMQAFAIAPGLSRSGSTLAGGLATGLNRKRAADFAFLMSIPAILGSAVMDAKSLLDESETLGISFGTHLQTVVEGLGGYLPLIAAVLTAALTGVLAIKLMLYVVKKWSLNWFALYTCILGCMVVAYQFFNGGF